MNSKNQIQIELLKTLLRDGTITRSQFTSSRQLRPGSVLDAVDDLKSLNLILEPSRQGVKTGRTSPELELNSSYGYFAGMEVTNNRILATLLDLKGRRIESFALIPPQTVAAERLSEYTQTILEQFRASHGSILGIALADPGVVDPVQQISLRAVGIPGWSHLASGKILKECSRGSTLVIPECAAKAALEMHSRQKNFSGSIFYLHLDSGVGAAYWNQNHYFPGDSFRAMEIGHLVLDPGGPLCSCGNRGCLEAIAGIDGIRRRVEELEANHVYTILQSSDFSLRKFTDAVAAGDRPAQLLASDICGRIAPVFAMAAALLNPGLIVIGGSLKNLGELLLDPVRRVLRERCLPGTVSGLKVEISNQDEFAGAEGAARLLLERYFKNQEYL